MIDLVWYLIPLILLGYLIKLIMEDGRTARVKTELQDIFDLLDPVALIDKHYIIQRCNDLYLNTVNIPYKKIIGKKYDKIYEGNIHRVNLLAKAFMEKKAQFLGHEKFTYGEFEVIYETKFHPIFKNGKLEFVIEIKKDVTTSYKAHRELENQKKQLEYKTKALIQKNNELMEAKRKIQENLELREQELNMAREIQQGLLPKSIPNFSGVKFWTFYEPIDSVGGDLYDIVKLSDYQVGIFIADVSGHGLPAAFVGALAHMSLASHAKTIQSPVELFDRMNADLKEQLASGYYLTGFYGILDLNHNKMQYVRASHPYPIILKENGDVELIKSKGLFLGLFDEPKYEHGEVQLDKGDKIYLFTDGCYSLGDGTSLTFDDYSKIVQKHSDLPIEEIYEAASKDVNNVDPGYQTTDDDRTFLAFEILKESRVKRFRYLNHFVNGEVIHRSRISSRFELSELMNRISDEINKHQFEDGNVDNIVNASKEVILNALEYGNKWDENLKVNIAFCVDKKKFKLSVSDRGDGFDYETFIRNFRMQRDNHRFGLFLVLYYMDEVHFDYGGSTVTIVKYHQSVEG